MGACQRLRCSTISHRYDTWATPTKFRSPAAAMSCGSCPCRFPTASAWSPARSPARPHRTSNRDFVDFFEPSGDRLPVPQAPHEKLVIRMQARVQVEAIRLAADFSPDLSRFPDEIANVWSLEANSPHHFLGASPRLPEDSAISAYARDIAKPGMTVLQIATASAPASTRISPTIRRQQPSTPPRARPSS
jgi:hypothetical protein